MNRDDLNRYLKEVRDVPFRWGVHDCLIFTNGAWRAMHGHGYADDWLGRYTKDGRPMTRQELIDEFEFESFTKAMDSRLTRVERTPPMGSIVTTRRARRWAIGNALGISVGIKAAFVTARGLQYVPIDTIDKAWA